MDVTLTEPALLLREGIVGIAYSGFWTNAIGCFSWVEVYHIGSKSGKLRRRFELKQISKVQRVKNRNKFRAWIVAHRVKILLEADSEICLQAWIVAAQHSIKTINKDSIQDPSKTFPVAVLPCPVIKERFPDMTPSLHLLDFNPSRISLFDIETLQPKASWELSNVNRISIGDASSSKEDKEKLLRIHFSAMWENQVLDLFAMDADMILEALETVRAMYRKMSTLDIPNRPKEPLPLPQRVTRQSKKKVSSSKKSSSCVINDLYDNFDQQLPAAHSSRQLSIPENSISDRPDPEGKPRRSLESMYCILPSNKPSVSVQLSTSVRNKLMKQPPISEEDGATGSKELVGIDIGQFATFSSTALHYKEQPQPLPQTSEFQQPASSSDDYYYLVKTPSTPPVENSQTPLQEKKPTAEQGYVVIKYYRD